MDKQSLLLLHGALGTKKQFDPLLPLLEDNFELYYLNFEGHGEASPTENFFRIEFFVENVLGYLDEHGIYKTNIFGYSMGGYVGLTLAKDHPERVKKVATLGTILQWDKEIAERECKYLYPDKIKEKVPHFAKQLQERHISGWERVVDRTRGLLEYLGVHPEIKPDDWKKIMPPLRFHIGDRDTTADLNKTTEIYRKIDKSELMVLPKTGHPIIEANKELLATSLQHFFKEIKKPDHEDRAQKENGRN